MFSLKILYQSRILYRLSAALENAASSIKKKSSNYEQSQFATKHNDHLQALKVELNEQKNGLSVSEWEDLRKNLISTYKNINSVNVDAVILGLCGGPEVICLAKSYMHYLQSSGMEANIATIGRLLRIYNIAYHAKGGHETALNAEEQQDILKMYAKLRERYEILDATTCENLICGLVCTKEWHLGLELLDMMKLTSTPSLTAYTELTIKAFSKLGDFKIGWRLLEQSVAQRKEPKCDAYIAYLKNIANEPANFESNFEMFLTFLEQNELIITEKVTQFITDNFTTSLSHAKSTQIDDQWKCANCGLHMRRIDISAGEYAKLSNSFLNKVLIRSDVFQKSTPEEVERFNRFITQTAPYDCVIDGLNVAYSAGVKKQPKMMALLLANVVKHFKKQGKHLLVLGRMHMNNWPKDEMLYIRRNAKLFLTNDLNPFNIWCARTKCRILGMCLTNRATHHILQKYLKYLKVGSALNLIKTYKSFKISFDHKIF
ncbi:mitochondrial ribonuclease P catalytic subunit isoform X2 [Eurosta solidaginis]|uniref:mitochondrial ribonuclease P catalytic subunit isoform X2 n=1 Tax=Eurosta solidaginis TaxID=178769 RepID=UPI0035315015